MNKMMIKIVINMINMVREIADNISDEDFKKIYNEYDDGFTEIIIYLEEKFQ